MEGGAASVFDSGVAGPTAAVTEGGAGDGDVVGVRPVGVGACGGRQEARVEHSVGAWGVLRRRVQGVCVALVRVALVRVFCCGSSSSTRVVYMCLYFLAYAYAYAYAVCSL